MSVTIIFNLFLLQMGCGMLALCLFLQQDEIDANFFKWINLLSFLFIIGGLLLRWHYGDVPASSLTVYANVLYGVVAAMALLGWGIIYLTLKDTYKIFLKLTGLLAIAAIIVDSLLFMGARPTLGLPGFLVTTHFLTTSWLLGAFLGGMLFGHWYLVGTDMPKKLLNRMAAIVIITITLKILAVGATWLLMNPTGEMKTIVALLTSFQGYGIFFWLRICVGLGIPAILAYMIWSTSRIGSNQSATAFMYIGFVFIIIGELISQFIFAFSSVPS